MSDSDQHDIGQERPPAETMGQKALRVLAGKRGQREQGHNRGPIVEWACRRWLSPERYAEWLAAGKLSWCAGAVCAAFDDAGSQVIKRVASLSCTSLLQRLRAAAQAGVVVEVDLSQEDPLPGDVLFSDRDQDGTPNHVVLVTGVKGSRPGRGFETLGGNSGPKVDAVWPHTYPEAEGKVLAVMRILV